jgi:hypothetical protein
VYYFIVFSSLPSTSEIRRFLECDENTTTTFNIFEQKYLSRFIVGFIYGSLTYIIRPFKTVTVTATATTTMKNDS